MDEEDEEEDQWLSKTPRLASLSQVFELCDLSLLFRQIMPLLIHGRKGFLLFSFFSFFFFFFFFCTGRWHWSIRFTTKCFSSRSLLQRYPKELSPRASMWDAVVFTFFPLLFLFLNKVQYLLFFFFRIQVYRFIQYSTEEILARW